MGRLLFICPSYGKFVYSRRAVASFLQHSPPDSFALVVDDCSPGFDQQNWAAWAHDLPRDRIQIYRFGRQDGLTRSWNHGLTYARSHGFTYAIAGNSDIIFTPGWWEPVRAGLAGGWHLLGPITNAPGRTNRQRQSVTRYLPGYVTSDDPADLATVAAELQSRHARTGIVSSKINGYCTVARTDVWWAGAFNKQYVFDPKYKLTGNEDELQTRWLTRRFRIGFVPSSFVFHYRAVSRGDKHKHTGWYRASSAEEPRQCPVP